MNSNSGCNWEETGKRIGGKFLQIAPALEAPTVGSHRHTIPEIDRAIVAIVGPFPAIPLIGVPAWPTAAHFSPLGRFMTNTTDPYAIPVRSCSACSMSSIGPSLLVQRPVGNCLAACLGASASEDRNFVVSCLQPILVADGVAERGESVPESGYRLFTGHAGRPEIFLEFARPPPVASVPGCISDAVVSLIFRAGDLIRLAAQAGEYVLQAGFYHE